MANTPIYSWPYPGTSDSPHGPNQLSALALAAETTVKALADTMAVLLPAAVDNHQNAVGTLTSTAYVEALTGGTPAGVSFVAPASGKVTVVNSAELLHSLANGVCLCSLVVRTGGTVGAGTVFLAASDDWARINTGTASSAGDRSKLVTGLTPGATYNVRQAFKIVTAGTGTTLRKTILVRPEFA